MFGTVNMTNQSLRVNTMMFKIRYQEPISEEDLTVYQDFDTEEQAQTFASFISNNGLYEVEYVTIGGYSES